MQLDDDELRVNFAIYGMREVCYADRFVRDMRDYIVRAVLRTLAGDVPQIVCRFDFGKLADEDEAEIYALCDAVFDSIFLDTEFIPGDDEWNEQLAAEKNVLKQGVLSGSVRAAVKAALAFRSLATRDDARAANDDDAVMTGTGSSGGDGCRNASDNFFSAHSLFPVQLCRNVMDGRDRGAVARTSRAAR